MFCIFGKQFRIRLAELYCIISQDQELVPDGHNFLVTNDKPFFLFLLRFYVLTLDSSLWFDRKFLCKPDDLVALLKLRCTLRVTNNCPRQKKTYALQRKWLEELPTVHERVDPYSGFNTSQETFNNWATQITRPWLKGKVRI